MASRETSIQAYHEIVDNGLLSKRHMEIYRIVASFDEPVTSGEAYDAMRDCEGESYNPLSQSRARFTELRDMGVLKECPVRECKISGRECITWEVVDQLPKKYVKPRSEKSRLRKRVRELLDRIGELEDRNIALQAALKGKTVQRGLF